MSDFNEKKHNWTPHLSEIDSQNNFNKNKSPKGEGWISMLEASKLCAYSQEYLSLLARREKIFSKKIGRNWYTTREAIEDYLKTQSVFVSMPKNIFGKLTASLTPEEPNEVLGHEGHSKVFEEFEKLNPQIFFGTPKEIKPQNPVITQPQKPSALVVPKIENNQFKKEADKLEEMLMQGQEVLPKQEILEDPVLKKLDRLSGSLELFADRVTRKLEQPKEEPLTPEQKEFIDSGIYSPAYRFRMFDKYARSMMSSPVRMMTIMITSVVMIFIIAGGFSFGQADYIVQQIKKAFKDADTIQGHFPGTHANEVLVLDKAGNVSIFGHIETEGQLRSHAPEGVAPIVVDSVTRVDNLNAEYLNGLGTNDFTLAFVTKNGNLTYEDVKLEGNVEVGKTLIVKGATKLLDSLQVYGNLGVFGDAVFGKDIVLQKGTIKISNTSLIKNLNAEFLDGTRKQDINLNFVTSNGANTSNSISVGGLEVNGTSQFNGVGFFNKGVWGSTGSFGSLGVASDASIGKKDNPDGSGFEVYSKYFSINNVGNTRVGGTLSAGNTTVGDLTVGGSVKSDLIPSGSLDLGSTTNPWTNIFGTTANFGNLVVSGSVDFSGTTSKSFVINTDNTTADTEDSYLAFERGTTTPNAQLKWNSTQNRFEFNESLFIASSSAETIFSVSGGPASISNTLYVQNSGNVGINYGDTLDAKFEVGGTASISGTLTTSTITASGLLSFSGTNHAGLKLNNLTTTERDLLTPASGMTLFNTSVTKMQVYNGTTWKNVGNPEIGAEVTSGTAGSVLFVDSSGNLGQDNNNFYWDVTNRRLGIGTGSPTTKFEVQGTASASYLLTTGSLQVAGGASVSYSRFGTDVTNHANYISASNDLLVSGDLEVIGTAAFDNNVVLGTTTTSILTVNSTVKSDLIPFTNAYNLGSTTNHWGSIYVDTANITNLNASTASISGTTARDFLINSDNATNDSENESVTFKRGSPTVNAALQWDSINKRFSLNFPLLIEGTDTPEPTYNFSQLAIKGTTDQESNDYVNIQTSGSAMRFRISDSGASLSVPFEIAGYASIGNTMFVQNNNGNVGINYGGSIDTKLEVGGTASISQSVYLATVSGNVGIGTTAPGNKLSVYGAIEFPSGATGTFTGTTTGIYQKTANQFNIVTGGTDRLSVDSSGNVGIGTTGQANRLEIRTVGDADGFIMRESYAGLSPLFSVLQNAGDGAGAMLKLYDGAGNTKINIDSGTGATYFNASGNVGIGSTAPAGKLDIVGDLTGSTGALFRVASTSELFRITEAGYVGIGTTSPTSLLTVQGRGEFQGTASASYLLTGNTLQVGGYSTVSYSRFGTVATTHGLSANNDLIINGNFEVDGTSYFDGTVNFTGIASASLFYAQNGTAASPSFSFASDQDTGMFRSAINQLGFSTLGTERLTIDSSGNVGINYGGTLDTKFEVGGTASVSGTLSLAGIITSTNIGSNSFQGSINTGLGLHATGNSTTLAQFSSAGTGSNSFAGSLELTKGFRFGNLTQTGTGPNYFAGNVGIGSTTPTAKLDVVGTAGNNPILNIASASGTSALFVAKSGNVGIGNTTPDAKLDVTGNITASSSGNVDFVLRSSTTSNPANNNDSQFTLRTGSTSERFDVINGAGAKLVTIASAGGVNIVGVSGANHLSYSSSIAPTTNIWTQYLQDSDFRIYENATGTGDRFTIMGATGNVGIGSTAPLARLDVVGGAGNNAQFRVASASGIASLYITKGSNVGIGTTAPSYKLDVVGDINIPTGSQYKINGVDQVFDKWSAGSGDDIYRQNGNVAIGTTTTTYAKFYVEGAASVSGNFGAGTDNTYSLGSANKRWKDIFVGPGSFNISSTTGTSGAGSNYTLGQIGFSGASLSFGTYDQGTGGYGSLEFKTASTSRMFISSGGNIGIGTTTPGKLLTLAYSSSDTSTDGALWIKRSDSNATEGLKIGYNPSGAGNSFLQSYTSGGTAGNLLLNSAGGNVGIGTTGPAQDLHISGAADSVIRLERTSAGVTADIAAAHESEGFIIRTRTAHPIRFATNTTSGDWTDSTRMIITSGGNVGIVDTSPDFTLDVKGTICQDTDSNESCDGTVTSDIRLKTNVETISSPLDKIALLRGVYFDWDENNPATEFLGRGTRQVGVIAQEIESVFPSLVYEDSNGYKMVDYQKLTGPLINAVNELNTKFNALASGSYTFTVNVASGSFDTLSTNQLCIINDCRSAWPTTDSNHESRITNLETASSSFGFKIDSLQNSLEIVNWKLENLLAASSSYVTQSQLTFALSNIATTSIDLSPYAKVASLSAYAKLTDIPSPVSLANLSGTITGDILPDTTNTYDIGSPTNRLNNIYARFLHAGDLVFSETTSAISNAPIVQGDILALYASSTVGGTSTAPMHLSTAIGSISGNIGIGTTTANSKLEVNGSIRLTSGSGGSIVFADGTTMSSAVTGSSTGGTSIGDVNFVSDSDNNGSGAIQFVTAATNRMTILNNGNVGIGTATPTALFEVNGAMKVNGSFSFGSFASVSTNFEIGGYASVGGNITTAGTFTGSSTGSNSFAGSLSVTKGFSFPSGKITTSGNVGIGTTNPTALLNLVGVSGNNALLNIASSSGTSALYVTKGGNVGIGTTAPGVALHTSRSSASNIRIQSTGTDNNTVSLQLMGGATNANWSLLTNTSTSAGAADNFSIFKGDGTIGAKLTINDAGNVGIGTTNPTAGLELKGSYGGSYTAYFENAGAYGIGLKTAGTTGSHQQLYVTKGDNTLNFATYADGTGYLRAAAWTYGSDSRLKENITYFNNGLDKITQLNPVHFDYIGGPDNNFGFIAQDVQTVIPEAVSVVDSTTGMLGLKTDFIMPYLVNAVKELNTSVQAILTGSASYTVTNINQVNSTLTNADELISASASIDTLRVANQLCLGGNCINAWPSSGIASSSLSAYALKTDLTPFALTASLSNFVTQSQLTSALSNLNPASVSMDMSSFAKTASLSEYAKLTDIPSPVSLANLSGTITGDIMPDTTNTYDIGSPTNRLNNIYARFLHAGDLVFSETTSAISNAPIVQGDILALYASSTVGGTSTAPMHLSTAIGSISGNIGIGTTTANSKLEVNGSIRLTSGSGGSIVFADGTTMSSAVTGSSTGGTSIGDVNFVSDSDNNGSGAVNFVTAATNRMTILNNGNVGIGTAVPTALFEVNGAIKFGTATASNSFAGSLDITKGIHQTGTSTNYFTGNVGIGTTVPSNLLDIYSTATASMDIWSGGTSTDKKFTLRSNYQGSGTSERLSFLNGAGTELMNIASTGYVGIGTTAPNTRFSVGEPLTSVVYLTGVYLEKAISSVNTGTSGIGALHLEGNRTDAGANVNVISFRNNQSTDTAKDKIIATIYAQTDNPYDAEGGVLTFNTHDTGTALTERMRINSSGNVGIGTTGPVRKFEVISSLAGGYITTVRNSQNSAGTGGILVGAGLNSSDSTTVLIGFYDYSESTLQGTITRNGASAVAYNTTSDRRLKENIITTSAGLNTLMQIPVSDFNFISEPGKTIQGFIAQDLYNYYPEAVHVGGVDPAIDPWQVDYGKLTPLLTASIQELNARTSFISSNTASPSMHVDATGNIGVGTTIPAYKLHVIGDIAGTSFVNISTREAKKDIEYVDEASRSSILDKLEDLRVAKYHYNEEDYSSPLRLGLIAEEAPADVLAIGGKGVDIYKLATFTLAGVQELAGKFSAVEAQVASQSTAFELLQAKVASLSLTVDDLLHGAHANIASGSVTVSSSGTGITDTMGTIANTLMTKVQNLWASGDIIAEGINKTYHSVANAFNWEFDLAIMMENWTSRSISISPNADATTQSLFSGNGAQASGESKLDLKENGAYLATYGVDSARGEIVLSGSSDLIGGEARVFFDVSFSSVISPDVPLKVLTTPTTVMQGQLYVSDKTQYGFVVKNMNGSLDGKFDWLVIARRKGYEGNDLPAQAGFAPSASASATFSPSPTPVVETTPTPTPDTTPIPTPDATPALTPVPDATPTPTPVPDVTPAPTPEPTLSPSPTPDVTPAPTPAPTPEPTPAPSGT